MEDIMSEFQNETFLDFFSSVLSYLDEGVYYVDRNRQILYWNQGAQRLTGYSEKEVVGRYCQDNLLEHVLDDGTCLCLELCPLAATILDGKCRKANVFLHHKEGHRVPISVQTLPIKDNDGKVLGALEVFLENPETDDKNEKLKLLAKLAYLDNTTNLPNQNYMMMKLKAILEELRRSSCMYGAVMERIDNYTELSNEFAVPILDRILHTAGNTLHTNIPATGIISRWDHQTFLIIVPNTNEQNIEILGRRLSQLVEQSTFTIDRKTAKTQMSFRCSMLEKADNEQALLGPLLNTPFRK